MDLVYNIYMQNDDEKWMQVAIAQAHESGAKYGHSVGAVIVRADKVVMMAYSKSSYYHAELNCVQDLLRKTGRRTLDGCVLYTTQESCSMCLGSALYANIERIVFGAFAADMPAGNDYECADFSLTDIASKYNKLDGTKIVIDGGVLRDDCKALTADHKFWYKEGFETK
jgi:tRNA(Arg) A34 adenosine deaminase TadA